MSLLLTAIDVPDLRVDLARRWENGGFRHIAQDNREGLDDEEDIARSERFFGEMLRKSELFWVSPEFMPLLLSAAASLPPTLRTDEVLSAADGFVVLGGRDAAIGWGTGTFYMMPHARDGVNGTALMGYKIGSDGWIPATNHLWSADDQLTQSRLWALGPHDVHIRRLFAAFNLLRNERLVADVHYADLPRPVVRRAARAKLPTGVRIVRLRELERSRSGVSTGVPAQWSHRWVVSGHWRNQRVGPQRLSRRLIWVHPHIKGPQEKPLVVRETVKALVR